MIGGARSRIAACAILLVTAADSLAGALNDHDNTPLAGIYGLPNSTEGSLLLPAGRQGWDFYAITSSHAIQKASGDELLEFDGETTRLSFNYRIGVSDRLELGVELPYLFHESGSLDSLISGWHELFGLPNGNRGTVAENRINIVYSDEEGRLISVDSSSSGIGDLRVKAGWQLSRDDAGGTALRFSVKLPTGDSDLLLGSGGFDVSVGIAGDRNGLWGVEKLSGFYRLQGIYLGKPDHFDRRYNPVVGQVSGGLGYSLHRRAQVMVQTTVRTALYDSNIGSIGDPSALFTFGANFLLGENYKLSFSVGEDINVTTAPDVTFALALRYSAD